MSIKATCGCIVWEQVNKWSELNTHCYLDQDLIDNVVNLTMDMSFYERWVTLSSPHSL